MRWHPVAGNWSSPTSQWDNLRMRITIDATSLLLRSAGVKNYIFHWLRHLRRCSGGDTRAGDNPARDTIDAFPHLGDILKLDHEASALPLSQTASRLALLYAVNAFGAGA